MKDPAGVAHCRAGLRGERRPPRTAGGHLQRAARAMTFEPEPGSGLSRQSIVTASADETVRSGGSVERSGIERGRRRRDVAPDLHFHFSFAPDIGRSPDV